MYTCITNFKTIEQWK